MERLICLVIGYAFGLIQTGYLYGKSQHLDIRKYGSGNAGTTNVLRTLGHLIFGKTHADIIQVLAMYTGMGVVLGHNYPFYMNFRGGKGIAVTAGLIASTTNWWITLICVAAFLGVTICTKYVSAGSLTLVVTYMICVIVYGQMGGYHVTGGHLYEIYGIAVLLVISAFYKHKANIVRLMNGTENKLSVGKKS